MYINERIPVKQLNSHKEDSETLFLEINLRLIKLLIVGVYKPPDQSKYVFLESLRIKAFPCRHIGKRNIIRRFQYDPGRQKLATFFTLSI